MKTEITGGFGSHNGAKPKSNIEIKDELIRLKLTKNRISGIINRLQWIRHTNGFFTKSFAEDNEKKFKYFSECLELIRANRELPFEFAGLRDQCIVRFLGPYFKYLRSKRTKNKRLPDLPLQKDQVLDLMDSWEVDRDFIKDIFGLDDEDLTS